MANIRENKKNGKVISFRFIVCLERDVRGKQIRKYTTWTAPADLTPAKARKAAERAADAWEEEVKAEYQKQKKLGSAYRLPPDKRRDDFVSFVNDTWFVLQIRGENDKPNTIAFYKNMTRIISEYFKVLPCRKSALLIFKNILSICAQSTRANWGSRFQRKLYAINTGRST